MVSKEGFRREMRGVLSALVSKERIRLSGETLLRLKRTAFWIEAQSLLVFLSFGNEIETDGVVQAALLEGKKVFAPRCTGENLSFFRVQSLKDDFEINRLGMREPRSRQEQWFPRKSQDSVLILVPGMAFDKQGGRLGRGKGYYDRFLSDVRKIFAESGSPSPRGLGYAFPGQVVGNLPQAPIDEPVDALLTAEYYGEFFKRSSE